MAVNSNLQITAHSSSYLTGWVIKE